MLTSSSAANLTLPSDPLLDGFAVEMTSIPFMVTSNPGVAELHSVLQRFAPGLSSDLQTITGWVSAKLFELATKNINGPITSESILAGLWSIRNNDLGGMTQPLTFTQNQPAQKVLCYWAIRITNRSYAPVDNGQRTCE
jgi:hypothetical protein